MTTLRRWWHSLWKRGARPEQEAPAGSPPMVLGVTLDDRVRVPALPEPERLLRFRGVVWRQQGDASPLGILTFVRETAVNGRSVLDEVQVHRDDLTVQPDGLWTLNGR